MELQFSFYKKLIKYIARIVLPLALATAILWWMYRDFAWDDFREALTHKMDWTWMWLSFPFGITGVPGTQVEAGAGPHGRTSPP